MSTLRQSRILSVASLAVALVSTPAAAEVESWYTYWGIGSADHHYPGDLDSAFRQADAYPGVARTEMSLEMLGFYWPLESEKMIVGFVISGSFDALDDGYSSVQLDQYLYGLSAMRFAGNEPGKGFFVRADGGLARAALTSTYGGDLWSESGFGVLGGVGYGVAISEQTRILLSATYSNSRIDGATYSTLAFTVGGLW